MIHNYLGIDPGTARIGWALIDQDARLLAAGVIPVAWGEENEKGEHDPKLLSRQISKMYGEARDLVRGHCHVVIERFAAMGLKASVTQAFGMGVVIATIRLLKPAAYPHWYIEMHRNRDVREWLCGSSKVKPAQVKLALQDMGYTEKLNEHTRDALALALYARAMGTGGGRD
ncbi:MAG: hypothetical protein ACYC3G_00735 [Minisyncoccota bacterium]